MKLKYDNKYQVKHLSIRVPWHDNEWSGSICSSPTNNDACLALKNCALNRDDQQENLLAGKSLSELEESQYPVCLSERAMFMADFDLIKHAKHPYANKYNDYYKHLQITPVSYTRYSAPAIPFLWMLPDSAKDLAKQYDLDFDIHREPFYKSGKEEKLAFTKSWIQDYGNQKALFDCFFGHIEPEESLSFFYAKEVPFIEDNCRTLVGLGRVLSVTQSKEYNSSGDSEFKAMPWEHMVKHSIRPDFEDGFLFPYQEGLEYQKTHPDFDIRQIVVTIPNEFRLEFSYATEHVSNDFALYVLRESVKKIELAKKLQLGRNWDNIIDWLQQRISVVEDLRGDYPGLGSALTAFGLERGHFLAQHVFSLLGENDCPWQQLVKIFQNPEGSLPENLAKSIRKENVDLWHYLYKEQKIRFQLLQLLSRFNLSPSQCTTIFNRKDRTKVFRNVSDDAILDNPYLIYEISISSIEPINYSTIDIGLMLNPF